MIRAKKKGWKVVHLLNTIVNRIIEIKVSFKQPLEQNLFIDIEILLGKMILYASDSQFGKGCIVPRNFSPDRNFMIIFGDIQIQLNLATAMCKFFGYFVVFAKPLETCVRHN